MDKARHPHVIRTWTVERTKVLCRQPQPAKLQPQPRREVFRGQPKNQPRPGTAPKSTE